MPIHLQGETNICANILRKEIGGKIIEIFIYKNRVTKVTKMDPSFMPASVQGCQIFQRTTYQNGKNIPNDHKIYQMDIQYSNMFHFKALQNIPKLVFLLR
jgi:hypothetical protein